MHASRCRATATHVRLAVVHRPGASSWDASDADVCVKHVAFVLMRSRLCDCFFSAASW